MHQYRQFALLIAILVSGNIWAGEVAITDSFVSGQSATAASINTKFRETGSAINDNNSRIANLEGGTSNTSGFAPANATAFEVKFINKTLTSSSGSVLEILSGKRFRGTTAGGTTLTLSYTYSKIGANTATLSYAALGETCTQTLTWISALVGSTIEICNGVPDDPRSFVFSTLSGGFAPANATAFETKFVGQSITITDSDSTTATEAVTAFESSETYSRTSANTASITDSNVIIDGLTCSLASTWTWTSALVGTGRINITCRDGGSTTTINSTFTFTFSGSN